MYAWMGGSKKNTFIQIKGGEGEERFFAREEMKEKNSIP